MIRVRAIDMRACLVLMEAYCDTLSDAFFTCLDTDFPDSAPISIEIKIHKKILHFTLDDVYTLYSCM